MLNFEDTQQIETWMSAFCSIVPQAMYVPDTVDGGSATVPSILKNCVCEQRRRVSVEFTRKFTCVVMVHLGCIARLRSS